VDTHQQPNVRHEIPADYVADVVHAQINAAEADQQHQHGGERRHRHALTAAPREAVPATRNLRLLPKVGSRETGADLAMARRC
jgi:hypothetical protein